MSGQGDDDWEAKIGGTPCQTWSKKVMEMMNGMFANGDDEKHKEEVGFGKEGKEFGS